MAKRSSADVGFLLLGGYDVLSPTTQLSDQVEALTEDLMGLGGSWEAPAATGNKRAEISQEGFFDDATDSINDALVGVGADRVLCYGLEGNTIGQQFVGFAGAVQSTYGRVISSGAMHKASANYKANGPVLTGVILHDHSAETAASGNTEGGDSVDSAASSANGGRGFLQVSALTLGGYDDVTVKVRDSADDITYADLVTFTDVAAAPAAESVTVTGTVNRYLAHSWVFNGAGSGQSITYMAGFARE